jgi:enoyl-CoA hydratase/carnithine racemase
MSVGIPRAGLEDALVPFDEYSQLSPNVEMTRRDGVLELRLHSDGDSLRWNAQAHSDLPDVFHAIAQDFENRVVILTGTGDSFILSSGGSSFELDDSVPPIGLDRIYREGKALLFNELAIPVPMIAAVNGPARAHCELALFCDIVIASETAVFQDRHLERGIVPGDGAHIVFPLAFGMNRGRYLALTGAEVAARKALEWGAVAEVVPQEQVAARAWDIALKLAEKPVLGLRYTREALTREVQRQLQEHLGYGLMLEGFASGYGMWDGTLHKPKS